MDHCSCSDYGCLPDYLSHENHEENKQAYQVFRLVIRAVRNIHACCCHHDYCMYILAKFKQLHPLVITLLLSGIVFLSGLLFNTLKKEHKAGNPDFLTGLSVRSATPRKIVDKKKIFNFILN